VITPSLAEGAADVLLVRPDVEGAQPYQGRAQIRTEWPGDDAGVGHGGSARRRKPSCQNVFELGAGASPPHLDGILHALAKIVPDVLVARYLDPQVLVSRLWT
jgi:hypothetical protein